jgi:hypothetical protein
LTTQDKAAAWPNAESFAETKPKAFWARRETSVHARALRSLAGQAAAQFQHQARAGNMTIMTGWERLDSVCVERSGITPQAQNVKGIVPVPVEFGEAGIEE